MKTPILTLAFGLLIAFCHPMAVKAQSASPTLTADTLKKIDSANRYDRTFTKVEIESEFPGGAKAWLAFLNAHLTYPNKAVRKRIEGTVVLQFIVDKEGNISNPIALTGDPILAEAALKALAQSPKWNPAMQDGRLVKSYKKQPIVFRLEAK